MSNVNWSHAKRSRETREIIYANAEIFPELCVPFSEVRSLFWEITQQKLKWNAESCWSHFDLLAKSDSDANQTIPDPANLREPLQKNVIPGEGVCVCFLFFLVKNTSKVFFRCPQGTIEEDYKRLGWRRFEFRWKQLKGAWLVVVCHQPEYWIKDLSLASISAVVRGNALTEKPFVSFVSRLINVSYFRYDPTFSLIRL